MNNHEIEPIKVLDEWQMQYLHYDVYFAIAFHGEMDLYLGMWCKKGHVEFFRHAFNYEPTRDEVEDIFFQRSSYPDLPLYPTYDGGPVYSHGWETE